MKTKLWLALLAAALFHAALFSAVAFWPKAPARIAEADFTAEIPFFDPTLSVPEEPEKARPATTYAATVSPLVQAESSTNIGTSTCPVHQIEMAVIELRLALDRNGRVIEPPGLHLSNPHDPPGALRAARFPNARSWAFADDLDPQHNARVFVCKECEREEREWKLTQGN